MYTEVFLEQYVYFYNQKSYRAFTFTDLLAAEPGLCPPTPAAEPGLCLPTPACLQVFV